MNEVTYSDRPGFSEFVVPPSEREESAAATSAESLDWGRILVPQMQRYLLLLVVAWVSQLLVLEPLLLTIHLMIGEPSIDDVHDYVVSTWAYKLFMSLLWRFYTRFCWCCERGSSQKFFDDIKRATAPKPKTPIAELRREAIQQGLIFRVANKMNEGELRAWLDEQKRKQRRSRRLTWGSRTSFGSSGTSQTSSTG